MRAFVFASLRRSPVFSGLPDSDLETIAGLSREAELAPGTPIFRHGDPATGFYVVVSGTVTLAGTTLARGACFGELDVLDDACRSATATTDGVVRLLAVTRADFEELLARDPGLVERLARSVASRGEPGSRPVN